MNCTQSKIKNPKYLTGFTERRLIENFNQKIPNYLNPLNLVIKKETITNEEK